MHPSGVAEQKETGENFLKKIASHTLCLSSPVLICLLANTHKHPPGMRLHMTAENMLPAVLL